MLTKKGIESAKEYLQELEVIENDIETVNHIARSNNGDSESKSPFLLSSSHLRIGSLPLHKVSIDSLIDIEEQLLNKRKRELNTLLSDLFHYNIPAPEKAVNKN